jgi:hypothetical protein
VNVAYSPTPGSMVTGWSVRVVPVVASTSSHRQDIGPPASSPLIGVTSTACSSSTFVIDPRSP